MKALLIIFFAVCFGLGVFIVARWYRRRHFASSNKNGGDGADGGLDGDGGGDSGGDGGDGGGD